MSVDNHLREIRLAELAEVERCIPTKSRILELGAGAGWQSARLAALGHDVAALDVAPDGIFLSALEFDVGRFDGVNIPYPDGVFDVVFSSNVLEHVAQIDALMRESSRVLSQNGVMIHIVPSAAWRFWTILAHYPFLLCALIRRGRKMIASARTTEVKRLFTPLESTKKERRGGLWQSLRRAVFTARHGEHGTAISELLSFRRTAWRKLLEERRLVIVGYATTDLFYTGYSVVGAGLSLKVRRRLARYFGSSCHIFVCRTRN